MQTAGLLVRTSSSAGSRKRLQAVTVRLSAEGCRAGREGTSPDWEPVVAFGG